MGRRREGGKKRKKTHNTTLQVVTRTAQEGLLLLDGLFWGHSGWTSFFAVLTSRKVDESAIKHWLFEKCRASCEGSKEG